MTHQGKQLSLGVSDPDDRAAAELAHRQLIEQTARQLAEAVGRITTPQPQPVPTGPTVAAAAAAFLAHCDRRAAAGRVKPESVANYRLAVCHLTAAFGVRPLAGLTAEELEDWAARPDWSSSYQHNTLGTVQQLLRHFGVALKISRPPKESRGAATVLTDDQFALVLREAGRFMGSRQDLPQMLTMLRETGARPQELAPLTGECVDWKNACTRRRQHKTYRQTGTDRVIHFTAAAMAVLAAQRAKHGDTGLLFRTRSGGAYRAGVIVKRLGRISDRLGFRVIAYGLGRHSFATAALANGAPDALVAELLGHKGTGMLNKHYAHLGQRAKELKAAAELATRGRVG